MDGITRVMARIETIESQVAGPSGSFQAALSAELCHARGYLAGRKKANVLPPGTSEHGNGSAVDITNGAILGSDDRQWAWLQDNARRFGWHPISNETWHWVPRRLRPKRP